MVIAFFSRKDKERGSYFIEESFLFPNINKDIVLKISFFNLSNDQINFHNQDLLQKIYIISLIFPIFKQIELIRKKKFVVAALNSKNEAFIVIIAFISLDLEVYQSCRVQISLLKSHETPISILSKYINVLEILS